MYLVVAMAFLQPLERMESVYFPLIDLLVTGVEGNWLAACSAFFIDRRWDSKLENHTELKPYFRQLANTAKSAVSQTPACVELRRELVSAVAFTVSRDPEISADYQASARYLFRVIADSTAHTIHPKDPEVKKRLDQVSRYHRS